MADSTTSSAVPEIAGGKHLKALDGVRGLAILLVIIHHTSPAPKSGVLQTFSGWSTSLYSLFWATWSGVDLFFVLSGFLITGILLDTKSSPGYFRNFYARRSLRIFPLYYATLAGFCIFLTWIQAKNSLNEMILDRLPWLVFYGTNIAITVTNKFCFSFSGYSLDHFWSLAVEEQFYLIWPAVVWYCSRRTLVWVSVTAIVAAIVFREYSLLVHKSLLGTIYLLPCRMDSLLIGGLLALVLREYPQQTYRERYALLLVSMVMLLLTFFDKYSLLVIGYDALALFYAAILLLSLGGGWKRLFEIPVLRWCGKYSYGMYVLHVPILFVIRQRMTNPDGNWMTLMSGTIAASFAAAFIVWHLLERPFLTLKKYFEYQPKPQPAPEPAMAIAR